MTEPHTPEDQNPAIAQVIRPVERDLGGFSVRRVLPAPGRRLVGPFIFFDHMGPAQFPAGEGIAVRPHPHIGLSTVTYLFEGQLMHRDSLGYVQGIHPGAVNLMVAGRGIVHSERAGDDLDQDANLHGIQTWLALPVEQEECEPAFYHHPAETIPRCILPGAQVTLIIGQAYGEHSPVATFAETLYLAIDLSPGAELELPRQCQERALYVVDGDCMLNGTPLSAGSMAVLAANAAVCMRNPNPHPVRAMLAGGETMGQRHIWWNFVSSRRDRIEQAKQDWHEGNFESVPGDHEWIPLPEDR